MSLRHWVAISFCVLGTACGGSSGDVPADSLPGPSPRPEGAAIVSAHRGGAAYAPENTMPAFLNAVRLGVDQLEADTQLTADNVLVLIHDDTLDRTTDCSGTLISQTLAQVQACDAAYWFSPGQRTTSPDAARTHPLRGQGIRVPTTEELFIYLQQLGTAAPDLSIEIKDIPGESNFDATGTVVAGVLVPLIRQYGLEDKIIVQAFWPPVIDNIKLMAPEIRTQFLTSTDTGQTTTAALTYATLRQHDIIAPNFDAPDMNTALIELAHGAGKLVVPWTVDREDDLANIMALGVDGIITNFPGCLLRLQGRLNTNDVGVGAIVPLCP